MSDVRVNNVEVFHAGDYGGKGSYSNGDLKKIAAQFAVEPDNSPVTIDHGAWGRAYGWVKNVVAKGKRLLVDVDLHEDFAEAVKRGEFPKRSIQLKRDPLRLGHLSFLGAASPAVKGMPDLKFSEILFDEPEGESIVFGEDAEIEGNIFTQEPEPEDCEIPLKDAEGNYSEKLVGRAISYFCSGGFGEKHEKILLGDPRYVETKHRIHEACEALGRYTSWASWNEHDFVLDPDFTADVLKTQRPDIYDQIKIELQEEIHMSEATKGEMDGLKAELETKKTETAELSEKLEAFEAKEAKAAMSEELDAAIAKSELPKEAASEIRAQFAERDNLDGLPDRIEGMKTLVASMSEGGSVNVNPPGTGEAGAEAALQTRAGEIQKDNPSMSYGAAVTQAHKENN